MKKLSKIIRLLIYILPLVLFFSYFPVISFGANETMNFELSLPLIWLVVFDVVGFVGLVFGRKFNNLLKKKWLYLILVLGFITASLIWSANFVRGLMTCGVMWLIAFAVFAVVQFKDLFFAEEFRRKFWRWFFGSALFVCFWCVLQCVLDLAGVSRDYSLMCYGCSSHSFGFPHPNGFAIEPQFMGNLLLAPAIVSAWFMMKQNSKNLEHERSRGDSFHNKSVGTRTKFQFRDSFRDCCENHSGSRFLGSKFLLFCFFVVVATLFLVFSRGAIYAFGVGMAFMSAFVLVRERKCWKKVLKRVGVVWITIVVGFLFTLNLQGIMTQVGPTDDTYVDGVARALNQLSLGIIDIRGKNEPVQSDEILESVEMEMVESAGEINVVESVLDEPGVVGEKDEATFDGYVEESTEIRKTLTRNAIKVWSRDVKTMLFGIGIGGAGEAMFQAGLTASPKELVQNEYVSLLLETGIVGAVLLIVLMIVIIRIVIKNNLAVVPVMTLLVTYGVTLVFFSGFANALQIYLLPVVLWCALQNKGKQF